MNVFTQSMKKSAKHTIGMNRSGLKNRVQSASTVGLSGIEIV